MGWFGNKGSRHRGAYESGELPLLIQPFPGGPAYLCESASEIASIPLTKLGLTLGWPAGKLVSRGNHRSKAVQQSPALATRRARCEHFRRRHLERVAR